MYICLYLYFNRYQTRCRDIYVQTVCASSGVVRTPTAEETVRAKTENAKIRATLPTCSVGKTPFVAWPNTKPFACARTDIRANRKRNVPDIRVRPTTIVKRIKNAVPTRCAGTRVWNRERAVQTRSAEW